MSFLVLLICTQGQCRYLHLISWHCTYNIRIIWRGRSFIIANWSHLIRRSEIYGRYPIRGKRKSCSEIWVGLNTTDKQVKNTVGENAGIGICANCISVKSWIGHFISHLSFNRTDSRILSSISSRFSFAAKRSLKNGLEYSKAYCDKGQTFAGILDV